MKRKTKILLSIGVVGFLSYSIWKNYNTKKKNLTSYTIPVISGVPIVLI